MTAAPQAATAAAVQAGAVAALLGALAVMALTSPSGLLTSQTQPSQTSPTRPSHSLTPQTGAKQTAVTEQPLSCAVWPAGSLLQHHAYRDTWSHHRRKVQGGTVAFSQQDQSRQSPTLGPSFSAHCSLATVSIGSRTNKADAC